MSILSSQILSSEIYIQEKHQNYRGTDSNECIFLFPQVTMIYVLFTSGNLFWSEGFGKSCRKKSSFKRMKPVFKSTKLRTRPLKLAPKFNSALVGYYSCVMFPAKATSQKSATAVVHAECSYIGVVSVSFPLPEI